MHSYFFGTEEVLGKLQIISELQYSFLCSMTWSVALNVDNECDIDGESMRM